ncbi:MAG: pyridoxal-phosphate dependent enzyme [Chloroflexota bacterium]
MTQLHIETPFVQSHMMGDNLNGDIWLKLDALQPCGSFKARGMAAACQQFLADGYTSFVSSSGGNAGLAVAWAGRRSGVPVTVVVPESTKERPKELIALEGAKVIVHGESWQEAHALATEIAVDGAALLHPFDIPTIWDGHASMIHEMAQTGIKPDAIVLSVGGGGLLIGVVLGLNQVGWRDVPVLALETHGAASLHGSRVAGEHITLEKIDTIATTLGAKRVAEKAFELVQSGRVYTLTVSDKEAVDACGRFLDDHRILVEPACGAALAAVYAGCDFLQEKQTIAVVVCGGAGVTRDQLNQWKNDFN